MSVIEFWNERARRFGHTGWADPVIYAYDQGLRLKAINQVLDSLPLRARRRALDFGCGSGDFSAMLAGRFESVMAYDIASEVLLRARERVALSTVSFQDQLASVWSAGPYDLILTVTVLQHVLDDGDLSALIAQFKRGLAAFGRVVVMETVSTQLAAGSYLKGRSEAALCAAFAEQGLLRGASFTFHHPSQAPTSGFMRYRGRLDVRLLGRLAGMRVSWAQRQLDAVAQRMLAEDEEGLRTDSVGSTRVLVFSHANEVDHA